MSTSPATPAYIEPWLRGTHAEVPVVSRAVLHALELGLDDLAKWTAGLTDAEVHTQPYGLPTVAFHLRHIARSVDRILSYAEGNQLTADNSPRLKRSSLVTRLWRSCLLRSRFLSAAQRSGCGCWLRRI